MQKEEYIQGNLFPPEATGGISLEDVFTAYFDCRRRKRGMYNSLVFEVDYERKCVELWRQINVSTYHPIRSIVFIVFKPVIREVFAPSFESRVVDHLIAQKIEPLFEEQFIEDNYATRKSKGTLYGINRVADFIRKCSANYTRDCYVMKLDIKSFFMSLPKQALYDNMSAFIGEHYHEDDLYTLLYMLRTIIFDRPELHCVRRCPRSYWENQPKEKSLFNSDGKHGTPIGRLTSQLSASFALNPHDHLVKEEWGISYYGRYVDDMLLVHKSKEYLLEVRERIREWLAERGFILHPNKMYIQHFTKGVSFVGGKVLPGRKYISNRSLGFYYDAIEHWNNSAAAEQGFAEAHGEEFVAVINSYLGLMKHFNTYNMRCRICNMIGHEWWKVIYIGKGLHKAILKKQYKRLAIYKSEIHKDLIPKISLRKINMVYDWAILNYK